MRNISAIIFASSSLLLSSCASLGGNFGSTSGLPSTLGESSANYGYIPLDALPINQVSTADSCKEQAAPYPFVPVLEALPDLSVRFAVAELKANGGLEFGPSKVTTENSTYRAVLDYVNVDAVPAAMVITRFDSSPVDGVTPLPITMPPAAGSTTIGYSAKLISIGLAEFSEAAPGDSATADAVVFPIYIGVGLRLTAYIRALQGGINLSGLSVIGANADANSLTGTMTVQTLGITGKQIATALPLPSKLDQTTIEQSILAIGTSRAVLYGESSGADAIIKTPRVVGLYSPVGSDPRMINAIYSELSRSRVPWPRPCITQQG